MVDRYRVRIHLEDLLSIALAPGGARPLDPAAHVSILRKNRYLRVEVFVIRVAAFECLPRGQLGELVEVDLDRAVGGIGDVHNLHGPVFVHIHPLRVEGQPRLIQPLPQNVKDVSQRAVLVVGVAQVRQRARAAIGDLPRAVLREQHDAVFFLALSVPFLYGDLARNRRQIARVDFDHGQTGEFFAVKPITPPALHAVLHVQKRVAAERSQGLVDHALSTLGRRLRPESQRTASQQNQTCGAGTRACRVPTHRDALLLLRDPLHGRFWISSSRIPEFTLKSVTFPSAYFRPPCMTVILCGTFTPAIS